MSKGRLFRYATVLIGLAAVAWLFGLMLFVFDIENMREPATDPSLQATDGIVVLTGGSERVTAGLNLLKAGRGKKLFISGVHPGTTLDTVFGNQQPPKDLRDCCIILGHAAETTMGNAVETLTWMEIENFHSLRLVTANYHMRRSLMIFHASMPDIQIIPYPVLPDSVKLEAWYQRPGTASLLVTEYMKYLFANVRLLFGPV